MPVRVVCRTVLASRASCRPRQVVTGEWWRGGRSLRSRCVDAGVPADRTRHRGLVGRRNWSTHPGPPQALRHPTTPQHTSQARPEKVNLTTPAFDRLVTAGSRCRSSSRAPRRFRWRPARFRRLPAVEQFGPGQGVEHLPALGASVDQAALTQAGNVRGDGGLREPELGDQAHNALMNRVETAPVNSPPRRWLQRFGEVPWLERVEGCSFSVFGKMSGWPDSRRRLTRYDHDPARIVGY